ncbi:hypothetical protein GBA52_017008 [Prunus armeniaca]|nr:hypothetical protein GBA52_017008 [Prunus armeniaca]
MGIVAQSLIRIGAIFVIKRKNSSWKRLLVFEKAFSRAYRIPFLVCEEAHTFAMPVTLVIIGSLSYEKQPDPAQCEWRSGMRCRHQKRDKKSCNCM